MYILQTWIHVLLVCMLSRVYALYSLLSIPSIPESHGSKDVSTLEMMNLELDHLHHEEEDPSSDVMTPMMHTSITTMYHYALHVVMVYTTSMHVYTTDVDTCSMHAEVSSSIYSIFITTHPLHPSNPMDLRMWACCRTWRWSILFIMLCHAC